MYQVIGRCISSQLSFQGVLISSRKGIRNLYSLSALGVDNYVITREKVAAQFHDMDIKFKTKMGDFADSNSSNMIFTEDLKHVIHLVEGKSEDLDLVKRMMLKFSQQNKELRFGSFIFGPVVMRMYHHLNKPLEALEIFKHPEMDGFFDQLISFQILMDLLLKHEMYCDVLEVFDIIKKKQLRGAKHPKNCVVLCFAACFKMNTPESFEYAKKLWFELNEVGHYPMRRAATFAAALALAQKAPYVALEILSSMKQQTYVTIRNLKVSALAELNRPDDALPILRSVLEIGEAYDRKHTFCEEVIEFVRQSAEKSGKKEILQEFQRIEKQLQSCGHISNSKISDLLNTEITISQQPFIKEQRVFSASFKSGTRPRYQRPGLQELL